MYILYHIFSFFFARLFNMDMAAGHVCSSPFFIRHHHMFCGAIGHGMTRIEQDMMAFGPNFNDDSAISRADRRRRRFHRFSTLGGRRGWRCASRKSIRLLYMADMDQDRHMRVRDPGRLSGASNWRGYWSGAGNPWSRPRIRRGLWSRSWGRVLGRRDGPAGRESRTDLDGALIS